MLISQNSTSHWELTQRSSSPSYCGFLYPYRYRARRRSSKRRWAGIGFAEFYALLRANFAITVMVAVVIAMCGGLIIGIEGVSVVELGSSIKWVISGLGYRLLNWLDFNLYIDKGR